MVKTEDPTPTNYRLLFLLSAIVIIIAGILIFIFASAVAGGIIALLGAVFGLGSQVIKNTPPIDNQL